MDQKRKRFPRQTAAFMVDGASISSAWQRLAVRFLPMCLLSTHNNGASPPQQGALGKEPVPLRSCIHRHILPQLRVRGAACRCSPGRQGSKQAAPRSAPLPCAVGACLGTPPLTVYIESASGIREGARTGIATLMVRRGGSLGGTVEAKGCTRLRSGRLVLMKPAALIHAYSLSPCQVGFCFFIALFFSPLLATVPPYATGPALILVGALMVGWGVCGCGCGWGWGEGGGGRRRARFAGDRCVRPPAVRAGLP